MDEPRRKITQFFAVREPTTIYAFNILINKNLLDEGEKLKRFLTCPNVLAYCVFCSLYVAYGPNIGFPSLVLLYTLCFQINTCHTMLLPRKCRLIQLVTNKYKDDRHTTRTLVERFLSRRKLAPLARVALSVLRLLRGWLGKPALKSAQSTRLAVLVTSCDNPSYSCSSPPGLPEVASFLDKYLYSRTMKTLERVTPRMSASGARQFVRSPTWSGRVLTSRGCPSTLRGLFAATLSGHTGPRGSYTRPGEGKRPKWMRVNLTGDWAYNKQDLRGLGRQGKESWWVKAEV